MIQSVPFYITLVAISIIAAEALPSFDDETYQELLVDPRTQVKTLYTSYTGIIITRVSSFISIFSSCLIILVILRSVIRLSTSYHRIIFGMSVADVFATLAMFCFTWPMPKDMIYKQFEGQVLGNSATCSAQGVVYFGGNHITLNFNGILCIYYLCIIRFKWSEEKIRKYLEPVLFTLAILFPMLLATFLVFQDRMAPSPIHFSCVPMAYPYWCISDDGNGYCHHGIKSNDTLRSFVFCIFIMGMSVIFSTMILICWTVYIEERTTKRYIDTIHARQHQENDNQANTLKQMQLETRTIIFQALGYLGAFLSCQIFLLLSLLFKGSVRKNVIYQYFHVVLKPLQGFFNLIIFMGHKVYNIRRSNNDITRWQAICQVLDSSKEEPTLFLSNINIVKNHNTSDDDGNDNMLDASFSEENGSTGREGNNPSTMSPEVGPSVAGISYNSEPNNDMSANLSGLSFDDQKEDKIVKSIHDSSLSENNHTQSKQYNHSTGSSWLSRSFGASGFLSDAVSSLND